MLRKHSMSQCNVADKDIDVYQAALPEGLVLMILFTDQQKEELSNTWDCSQTEYSALGGNELPITGAEAGLGVCVTEESQAL